MFCGKIAGWKMGAKSLRVVRSLDVGERRRERAKSPVLDAKLEMREGARPKRSEATTQGGMHGRATSEIWPARRCPFGTPLKLNT